MGRRRSAIVTKSVVACLLGAVTSGVLAIGTAERAAACSCAVVSHEEAFANADTVFTGTLVDVITPPGETFSSADPERFVFEVDEVFKGDVVATQTVVTARDGASCGLEINGPGPFVVFARTEPDGITTGAVDGELYSNLCSGTRPLADGALPADLADGSPPRPTAPVIDGDAGAPTIVWIGAAAGGLAAVAAGAVAARRRFRPIT